MCPSVTLPVVFLCAFHEKSRTSFAIKHCYLFYRIFGIIIHLLEINWLPLIICFRTVVGVSLCAVNKETCTVIPRNPFCCFMRVWDGYRLLETVVHFLEIKWRLIKNLLRCGCRRDLVRFSQGDGCTGYDDSYTRFFMCVWDGYSFLWADIRLMEIKLRCFMAVVDVSFVWEIGNTGNFPLLRAWKGYITYLKLV